MGKLLETFCFNNLKALDLKISEDRHEFYYLLKKNPQSNEWEDYSLCIKNIVNNASQLPKEILEKPPDQWREHYWFHDTAAALGTITIQDITSIVNNEECSVTPNGNIPKTILYPEYGSGFYPRNPNSVGSTYDMTEPCLESLGKRIAKCIKIDPNRWTVFAGKKFTVAIVGCVGSALNTINLCASVLKHLGTKDVKLHFCVYDTCTQKCNEGLYYYSAKHILNNLLYVVYVGQYYAQYESQITFHNEDFLRYDGRSHAQPNMIIAMITGSISNLLQHKLIWHSAIHKTLLMMPHIWYSEVNRNYGLNLVKFEHLPGLQTFLTVELCTQKEKSSDMSLKVARVNLTADQLTNVNVYFFNEILIGQNLNRYVM
jgi:hypothetical protein